ncbi:MAG: PEP-CTERM sorting domain-containing protein [Candidatus Korobacteraceae bacterium]
MRTLSLLTILCLVLGATAFAGNLYTNGPTNGTNDGYFIDVYEVSDSYTIGSAGATGFDIAEWVPSGATPLTVSWSLGTTSFGSQISSGGGAWTSSTLLCTNGSPYNGGVCAGGFGYDIYQMNKTFVGGPYDCAGTCYLSLTGATDSFGGRDAWDINSGPSAAYHNLLGAVPSESFTITGGSTTTSSTTTSTTGTTPEPSSILLLGSGALGLAGLLRRKLR